MSEAMPLEVLLFASLKETAGRAAVPVAVPVGTTARELMRYVRDAEPALAPFLAASRVAVNLAFAGPEQVLEAGDQVALIPPVGGG